MDSKIATALLDAVTTAALDAALLGKADACSPGGRVGHAAGYQDSKCPAGLATEAFVAAQLASRDASITALQGAKADATLLASYATNAALSASETVVNESSFAEVTSFATWMWGLLSLLRWPTGRHAEHHGRLLLHGGH